MVVEPDLVVSTLFGCDCTGLNSQRSRAEFDCQITHGAGRISLREHGTDLSAHRISQYRCAVGL